MSRDSEKNDRAGLRLRVHEETYAICRLSRKSGVPRWVEGSTVSHVSRTPDELSVVCEERLVPKGVKNQGDWRAIEALGPIDWDLVGVLASLAAPLAEEGIGLFTVSTYDTDYLYVRDDRLDDALDALEDAGHEIVEDEDEDEDDDEDEEDDDEDEDEEDEDEEDDEYDEEDEEDEDEEDDEYDEEDDEDEYDEDEEDDEETLRLTAHAATSSDQNYARLMETAAEEDEEEPEDDEEPEDEEDDEPYRSTPKDELPADEREEVDEEELEFKGAIPQHDIEAAEDTWQSLGLSDPITETVLGLGFEHPTAIQVAVLPIALEGTDVIGLAETGSGKTAAFCLPLAERLTHGRGIRGLILCPTREIALQTKGFLDSFGRDHELETAVVIGGVKMGPQIQALKRKPDIIVATPGRLADHMRRRNVHLGDIEELVLDEADHMLDLGFLPQIQEILVQVPEDRRTMMFSATMPPLIERLAQRFMDDPYLVDQRPVSKVASGIAHRLYLVKSDDEKKRALIRLLEEEEGTTLVFARRKIDVEWLAGQLKKAGLPAERIHSDRSQAQRVQALKGFREGKFRILVATDVAARGIDVPRLEHVVNYELPDRVEDYVHRAGRTARGKAVGTVHSIGTWQDKPMVKDIEHEVGEKIPRHHLEGVDHYKELKKKRGRRRRRLL